MKNIAGRLHEITYITLLPVLSFPVKVHGHLDGYYVFLWTQCL